MNKKKLFLTHFGPMGAIKNLCSSPAFRKRMYLFEYLMAALC